MRYARVWMASDRVERGQALVLFALSLVVLLLAVGLVIDGGTAYVQRRTAQNAADFAAMAGTRIVAEELSGDTSNGTAANVEDAIQATLESNNAELVSAKYVSSSGGALGDVVGASSIPTEANGVVVTANLSWHPFFLGVVGITSWTAGATATAMSPGSSTGGGVLPVGMQDTQYESLIGCPLSDLDSCIQQNLTSGGLNIPGGFGWLKFGCSGYGLGQTGDGCGKSQPFLQSEVGPPANSFGCCTAVGQPGSLDQIGSVTGNKPADLSFYIENQIPVWVPIWDTAGGNGSHAYYHIVGFGAIVFVGEDTQHGKWLTGSAVTGVGCPGAGNAPVEGTNYCQAPGGAFLTGVSGAVYLVR